MADLFSVARVLSHTTGYGMGTLGKPVLAAGATTLFQPGASGTFTSAAVS